jgi:hypothetical protein
VSATVTFADVSGYPTAVFGVRASSASSCM